MSMGMGMNMNHNAEQRASYRMEIKLEHRLELQLDSTAHMFMYEGNKDGSLRLFKMFKPDMRSNEEIYAAVRSEDRLYACILEYFENKWKKAPKMNIVVELYKKEPFRRVKRFEIGAVE